MAQKLEHLGLIVFIDGAIHLLSLYLTSLLCSSGLAIRDGFIRYHIAAPGARRPRPLPVQILLQLSTYHIEVLPLESGKSVSPGGVPRKPILSAEWGMRCCKNKQCTRRELRSLLRHVHRISPAVVGKSWDVRGCLPSASLRNPNDPRRLGNDGEMRI
ncbi:hypothetical protein V8E52_005472, partial [Russula decolorans]